MQDMMHCLHPSILERQRAQLEWQQQQESNNNNNNFSIESLLSMQGDGWPSLTSSAPYPIGIRDEERGTTTTNTTPIPTPTTSNVSNSISSKKKRKADNRTPMEGGDDDGEKRMKKGDEGSEGEKKQRGNRREDENNEKKVDYIHVRARRGQATDSHSLAERVRRERISERMKYLQGLVPGCDKVTGKAGMLDEIINYVQSLQRQVEFLSMKLATVNPRPDLNMETLISKEMMNNVVACNSHSIHNNNNSSSSMGIMQELMLDPSLLLHLSSMQQSMAINPVDLIALQRSTISMPEPFILDSCFNAMQRTSSGWDSEVQSLSGVEFHQGRSSPFLFQSLQGNVSPNNLKMEM